MTRPKWKAIARAYRYQSMKRLARAVRAEQQLAEVPKPVRVLCRIVGRLLRGRLDA